MSEKRNFIINGTYENCMHIGYKNIEQENKG